MVNLKYDWLMMMSLGGAVVSFYHVISMYIRWTPVFRAIDFGTFGYSWLLEVFKLELRRFNNIIKL